MACPTPEVMEEFNHLATYLYFNSDIGLTFEAAPSRCEASADASWEECYSTSGWYVRWQGCLVSWGSSKQHCVALSSCEAEIVALSECVAPALRKKSLGKKRTSTY